MSPRDRFGGIDPQEWAQRQDTELARLLALRTEMGYVPENDYRIAGDRLFRCEDTVRRMLDAKHGPPPQRPPSFVVTPWWMDLLFAHKDNVARLYRDAVAAEIPMPSLSTVYRAFNEVDPIKRTFATKGAKGYRDRLIYLTWDAEARNDIWQADSCELDIFVLSRNGKTSVKPHFILFLDDAHRFVTGWGVTFGAPTAADVAAVFAEAVLANPYGGDWQGGVPNEVLWDNGGSFKADEMTILAMKIGTDAHAVKRYTPTKKGKVEKWFRDFQEGVLEILPGSTTNPESWTRRDINRPTVYHGPLSDLLTQDAFAALVGNSIRDRMLVQRPAKGGPTVYERWCSDPNPLVQAPREAVRHHLRRLEDHVIGKQGIEYNGKFYVPIGSALEASPRLRVGEEVAVRTLYGSAPWLEVFDRKGRWIDTFKPSTEFTDEEIGRREEERLTLYHEAAAHARKAGDLRRARARQIDETGAMPSLAEVALAMPEQPATPAKSPKPKRTTVDGRLFALPSVNVAAAVVAARKTSRQHSRGSQRAPEAPTLALVPAEESA